MPQPLDRVPPENSLVIFGNAGDRAISRRPALAVLALEALASWSNVESFMLRLFVTLFGGHGSLAADVFLALDGQTAKRRAIDAAAEHGLSTRQREHRVLKALLRLAETHEKSRNKLAHWTWGESPQLPDALLLLDPRQHLGDELDRSRVYVYRANDFEAIIRDNDRLCGIAQTLHFVLTGHIANRDGRLLDELEQDPEIAQRLR